MNLFHPGQFQEIPVLTSFIIINDCPCSPPASLLQCPQPAFRLHCRYHWIGMSLHNMVAYCIPISNPGNHQFSSLRFQSLTPLGEPSQAWAQFFQTWNPAFSTLIPVPRQFWVETLLGCSVIFFPLSMPLSLKEFYLTSPLSSLLGPPLSWSHPKSFPPQNEKHSPLPPMNFW